MKKPNLILLSFFLYAVSLPAASDPWKDESGHGKRHGHDREYKEEYWDGNCKIERKMGKKGEYKEERKCKPMKHSHHHAVPVYVPAPPLPVLEPGVTIHGTIRIPH